MIVILIEPANSLRINDDHRQGLSRVREARQRSAPHPDSLRARVDRRSDTEALLPVQEDTVEEIRFSSAVHTRNRHHSDRPLNLPNNRLCLRVNFKCVLPPHSLLRHVAIRLLYHGNQRDGAFAEARLRFRGTLVGQLTIAPHGTRPVATGHLWSLFVVSAQVVLLTEVLLAGADFVRI